jgi:hypothetical protein
MTVFLETGTHSAVHGRWQEAKFGPGTATVYPVRLKTAVVAVSIRHP